MSGPSSSSLSGSTSRSGGYPSLDAYALSFRSELRDQGRTALASLSDLIQSSGYDWLDAFMETALDGASSGAPLTQLIKTPSRTATAKKTRATTAAGKERADKLKVINSENPAIGSQTSKLSTNNQTAWLPLSPLQPRSLNSAALAPRSPLGASSKQNIITISASPSPSPTPVKAKGKAKKAAVKPAAKAPKGGKRGKAKQQDSDAENRASPEDAGSSARSSQREDDQSHMDVDKRTPAPSPSPSPAKARYQAPKLNPGAAPLPVLEPIENAAEEGEEVHEAAEDVQISITVDDEEASSVSELHDKNGAAPVRHDLSIIAEEDSSARTDTSLMAPTKEAERMNAEAPADVFRVGSEQERAEAKAAESAAPRLDRPSTTASLFTRLEQRESTNATASASTAAAPADAPPPVPLHNVRSSWLRSALGGSGASSAADSNRDSLRQSYAAHSARQPSLGFEGLRKSLAPAGGFGLKRKSEEGLPEEARAEKVVKLDNATGPAASAPRSPIAAMQPSKNLVEGASSATAAARTVKPDGIPPRNTEMDKVTQALDQLRQQNQQKELNRQKAAAQGAATPAADRASNQPAASGSGFLMRGLTNLGTGLGRSLGLGSTARNTELDNEKEVSGEDQAEVRPAPTRPKPTTASLFNRPMAAVAPPVRDRESAASLEDEETQDEHQVMQDLEFVTAPLAPLSMLPAAQSDQQKLAAPQPEMKQVRQATVVQPPPASPLRVTRQALQTTTPSGTPPRAGSAAAAALSPSQARSARHPALSTGSDLPLRQSFAQIGQQTTSRLVPATSTSVPVTRPEQRSSRDAGEDDKSMEDGQDEREVHRENDAAYEQDGFHSDDEPVSRPVSRPPTQMSRAPSSASLYSLSQTSNASSSTAVASGGSIFTHAHKMAEKAMGIRPSVAPVRSIQLAQSVAKKDLAASERRVKEREQTEQRKRELAEKRAEADRLKAEEDKRAKNAEIEERKRQRAADERRRREQEERKAAILREKRRREEEEKERDAIKQKAAEEQERKRRIAAQQKTAQALQAAQAAQAAQTAARQKAAAIASGTSAPPIGAVQKAKAALPIIKPVAPSAAAAGPSKPVVHGPSVFRTAATTTAQEQVSSTITLVTQQQVSAGPRPLGPPSRPSAMLSQQGTASLRTSVAVQHQHHLVLQQQQQQQQQQAGPSSSSAVLQHSRVVLQTQLDERAAEIASEDIELPDIASEYSNSDEDEDERAKGFVRPDWAMSPALRAQLVAQAHRDPDELFGPIKPPNMEELFKARHNKFRKRTSSANWAKGDGLTKDEEREYARKMGFRRMGE